MGPNILSWLASALVLVENYAVIRSSGGTAFQANIATLQAITDLVAHLAAHPSVMPTPAIPAPAATTSTTAAVPGMASAQ